MCVGAFGTFADMDMEKVREIESECWRECEANISGGKSTR